jgi:hypothetical protein
LAGAGPILIAAASTGTGVEAETLYGPYKFSQSTKRSISPNRIIQLKFCKQPRPIRAISEELEQSARSSREARCDFSLRPIGRE